MIDLINPVAKEALSQSMDKYFFPLGRIRCPHGVV